MSSRKEALCRLKDPRPPLHWGEFPDVAALDRLRTSVRVQNGDTAATPAGMHVFVASEWSAPLGVKAPPKMSGDDLARFARAYAEYAANAAKNGSEP